MVMCEMWRDRGNYRRNERKCEQVKAEVAADHPERCRKFPMLGAVKASYKRCNMRWSMTGCDGYAAEHHGNGF